MRLSLLFLNVGNKIKLKPMYFLFNLTVIHDFWCKYISTLLNHTHSEAFFFGFFSFFSHVFSPFFSFWKMNKNLFNFEQNGTTKNVKVDFTFVRIFFSLCIYGVLTADDVYCAWPFCHVFLCVAVYRTHTTPHSINFLMWKYLRRYVYTFDFDRIAHSHERGGRKRPFKLPIFGLNRMLC